jgi:MFS family permease
MNDLFFLHERGTQAGVQGTWLSLGSSLAPIVCGFLIQSKGWRWYHWLVTILAGVNVLLVVLLVPETRYHRSQHTPSANPDVSSPMPESKIDIKAAADNKFDNVENVESNHYEIRPVVPRKQRWQQLNPWSGVDTQVNLGAAFLRPWIVWCYPAVVWACLSFSIHVAW